MTNKGIVVHMYNISVIYLHAWSGPFGLITPPKFLVLCGSKTLRKVWDLHASSRSEKSLESVKNFLITIRQK